MKLVRESDNYERERGISIWVQMRISNKRESEIVRVEIWKSTIGYVFNSNKKENKKKNSWMREK